MGNAAASKLNNSQTKKENGESACELLAKETPFELDDLKQWYSIWNDEYHGKMTKKQFIAVWRPFYKDISDEDLEAFWGPVFRAIDDNNNGTIDFVEWVMAVSLFVHGLADTKLKWAFQFHDKNGDNVIDFDEFSTFWRVLCRSFAVPMRLQGEGKDRELFSSIDSNGDGNISQTEFVNAVKSDSLMWNFLVDFCKHFERLPVIHGKCGGWLRKKSKMLRWKQRWCVLDNDDVLAYYESPCHHPLGTFKGKDICKLDLHADKLQFEIAHSSEPDRIHLFEAENRKEYDKWSQELKRIMQQNVQDYKKSKSRS
eukprot:gb/GECH01008775.1/.p1 GENE.gb/GECH01008775.1/~~gb/GECH01008775.1/.p1  ORF type:complete len:312 (+),score=100.11 gb/GECH01008775.1/:1-936(+)